MYNTFLSPLDGLKTVIAPTHLPTINPPQYSEIYGAISASFITFSPMGFN